MTYSQLQKLENDISIFKYDLMLHAIGFKRNQVHRYKIHCYRNYFCESSHDTTDWDKLVELGVAELITKGNEAVYYRVSQLGIEFIQAREGVKIIFDAD